MVVLESENIFCTAVAHFLVKRETLDSYVLSWCKLEEQICFFLAALKNYVFRFSFFLMEKFQFGQKEIENFA